MIHNLLPVTLGNLAGGAGMVGLVYHTIYRRGKPLPLRHQPPKNHENQNPENKPADACSVAPIFQRTRRRPRTSRARWRDLNGLPLDLVHVSIIPMHSLLEKKLAAEAARLRGQAATVSRIHAGGKSGRGARRAGEARAPAVC